MWINDLVSIDYNFVPWDKPPGFDTTLDKIDANDLEAAENFNIHFDLVLTNSGEAIPVKRRV